MFSDISNRDNSNKENTNKDNPGFGNLKVNSKDNLRFSNPNNSNSRDDNLRFSNHNTLSLKENLKEGRKKNRIESRMTKGSVDDQKRLISIKGARVGPIQYQR